MIPCRPASLGRQGGHQVNANVATAVVIEQVERRAERWPLSPRARQEVDVPQRLFNGPPVTPGRWRFAVDPLEENEAIDVPPAVTGDSYRGNANAAPVQVAQQVEFPRERSG